MAMIGQLNTEHGVECELAYARITKLVVSRDGTSTGAVSVYIDKASKDVGKSPISVRNVIIQSDKLTVEAMKTKDVIKLAYEDIMENDEYWENWVSDE